MTQSESELKVVEEERDALVLNCGIGLREPTQLVSKNDFIIFSEAARINS